MTLNEYQKKAMTTNAASSDNDSYSLFGLVAEVGEIADKIAKGVRNGTIIICDDCIHPAVVSDEPEVRQQHLDFEEGLKKELGDVLWFCAHLADRFSWPLEEVAQTNLDKLTKRKAEGTIITHTDH